MKIYFANMETQNFTFSALGETRAEAVSALKLALKIHGEQHALPRSWSKDFDFEVFEGLTGVGYRDGSKVTP